MSAEKTSTRASDETQGPSAAASTTTAPTQAKRGLFGRKRPQPETYAEKIADQSLDVNPEGAEAKKADIQPASFSEMFR
jgi:hypothetical protein